MNDLAEARQALVVKLRQSGTLDERVLEAIGRVPREAFVSASLADQAYEDTALPIGQRQTISQPKVVAIMTEALRLGGTERVLEIGTGSGYQTAILAELAGAVVSVERVPELLQQARQVLGALGYRNVQLELANGSLGWLAGAPYDGIIVTAAGPEVPAALLDQLAVRGRLVMPIGSRSEQHLVVVTRGQDGFVQQDLGGVRFVPLIGEGAWPDDPSAEGGTA